MARLQSLGRGFWGQKKRSNIVKRFVVSLVLFSTAGLIALSSVSPAFAAYLDEMIGTYTPGSTMPNQWDNTYSFLDDNSDGIFPYLGTYQQNLNLAEQEGSAVYNGSINFAARSVMGGYFNQLADLGGKPVTVVVDLSGFIDDASEYEIADELNDAGPAVDPANYTLEKDGDLVTITFPKGFFKPELLEIMTRMSADDASAMTQVMTQLQDQWSIDYPDDEVPEQVMRDGYIAVFEQYMADYVDHPDTYDWAQLYDDLASGASMFASASLDFSLRYPYIGDDQPTYLGDGKLTGTVTICRGAGGECTPQSYAACDEQATGQTRCVRFAEYGYPTLETYSADGWDGVHPLATVSSSLMARYNKANPVRFPADMLETDTTGSQVLDQNDVVLLGFHQSRLQEGQEASYDVNITSLLDDFDIESQFYYRYSYSPEQGTFMADPPDPSYGTVEIVDGHVRAWVKNVEGSEDIVLGLKLKPKATGGDGVVRIVQRTCAVWPGETATTAGCVAPERSPNIYNYGMATGEEMYTISRYKLLQSYEVAGGGPVVPGATLKYTTTVQNLGGTPASGAVNLDLRRLLDHVEWLDDVDVNYPQGTGVTGRWWGNLARGRLDTYFHQLAPHASSTMSFSVKVKEDTAPGTELDTLSWYCNPYTGCDSDPEECSFVGTDPTTGETSSMACTGGLYGNWVSIATTDYGDDEAAAAAAAIFEAFVQSGIPTTCTQNDNSCSQSRLTVQALGGGGNLPDKALAVEDNPVNLDSTQQPALTVTNKPYFSGKTEKPFTPVTVTVHSDPVSCSTTSDAQGNWSCTLPTTILAGTHTARVYVTDPDSDIVTTYGPYNLMVNGPGSSTITNTSPLGAPDTGIGLVFDVMKMIVLVVAIFAVPTALAIRYRLRASSHPH